jgi:hypothetical protein
MPFRLNDDLRVFTQIMKKCVMAIREIWKIRCVVYLDNLVLLHSNKNHLEKLAPQITQFLQHFGWTVNLEKSHLQPTQQFQYLGWIWDSTTITVQLPTTERQTSENIKRIKNCKEENLQKENNFCKNCSNFDWDAFRYKDTIPQRYNSPRHLFTSNDFPQYFILVSTRKDGTLGLHGPIEQ